MFTPIYKLKQRVKRKLTLSVLKSPTSHPPLTDPGCTASCSLSDSELCEVCELCDKQTRSENFNSRKNLVLSKNKLLPTNTSTQLPRPTPELFSDDDCKASSTLNVANDLSVLRTIEAELDMDDSIALSTIFPDMTDANISKMTTRGGSKSQRVKRGASADDSLDNVQCDSANDPPTDYISQSIDLSSDTVQRNSTIDSPTICNPDPKKKSKKVVKRRSARLKNATLDKVFEEAEEPTSAPQDPVNTTTNTTQHNPKSLHPKKKSKSSRTNTNSKSSSTNHSIRCCITLSEVLYVHGLVYRRHSLVM